MWLAEKILKIIKSSVKEKPKTDQGVINSKMTVLLFE